MGTMSPTSTSSTGPTSRPTIRIALPNGWARSGLAGIEAALIGWGLIMVLTLVGYLAVSANPWLGGTTWADATGVGGDLWGATLAAPVHVGELTLRAVPTLMTLLVVLILRLLLLTGRAFAPAAQWMAVPTFTVTALALLGATAGHVSVVQAAPGALAVAAVAALWAVVDQTDTPPTWTLGLPWLWEGLRQARLVLAVLAVVGASAAGVSLHSSWEQVQGIHELLLTSTTDSVVVALAQVLFAPTAMAWALSWLAGPGFWVGADTLHAPGTAPVAPIPAIPLLGAVPATAPGNVVALILVGVGVLLGIWLRWRHRADDLRAQVLAGAACAGATALVLGVWFASSTLCLGSGRMSVLGPRVLWATAMVVLEVVVVAQVLALATHPYTVARLRSWTGTQAQEVRSRFEQRRAAGNGEDPGGRGAGVGIDEAPATTRGDHPGPAESGSSTGGAAGRRTPVRASGGDDMPTQALGVAPREQEDDGAARVAGDPDDMVRRAPGVPVPPGSSGAASHSDAGSRSEAADHSDAAVPSVRSGDVGTAGPAGHSDTAGHSDAAGPGVRPLPEENT